MNGDGIAAASVALAPTRDEAPVASHRQRQRSDWDRIAASVGDLTGAPSTGYYRRCEIALLRRCLGDLAGKRVLKLDLWNEAFNTRILHWMAEQGAEVYGLDLSNVVAHQARRNRGEIERPLHLMRADIRDLPFADGSFDAVYTMGTIEHIDEYVRAIDEVRRVLKPGGRAIIGVPHKWNLFLRPLLVWALDLFGKYAYAPEKSFGAGELRRDIESTGLEVGERTGILSIPGLLRIADVFCWTRGIGLWRLSPVALWPFELLETRFRWPGRFGYLMAMVATRPADGAAAPGNASL